jgi:hypothetical protein
MDESRATIHKVAVVGDEDPFDRLVHAQFDTIVSANAIRALLILLHVARGGAWSLLNYITELDLEYLVKSELIQQPRPGVIFVM